MAASTFEHETNDDTMLLRMTHGAKIDSDIARDSSCMLPLLWTCIVMSMPEFVSACCNLSLHAETYFLTQGGPKQYG